MKKLNFLVFYLKKIIEDETNALDFVKKFQEEVWNIKEESSQFQIFSELAYNIDFFEPDENTRKESHVFFGYKKLICIIKEAIVELDSL